MIVTAEYATHSDLYLLERVFLDVLLPIPYYNVLAKETERKKYAVNELERKLSEDPRSIIIIKNGNAIAAFCLSRFDDYTIWLEWFGVAQAYRGRKLTAILFSKLEASARERNCHKIWCDSRTENQKAIDILLTNGFEQVALLKQHWYRQDFYLWQKIIDR